MIKKRIIPKIIVRKSPESSDGYAAYVSNSYSTFFSIGILSSQLRIFESNRVDELMIINADKSDESISESFLSYLSDAISVLRTPITVGGGIESISDAENLIAAGADKLLIGLNDSNPSLIQEISSKFGAQAVVGSIDYSVNQTHFLLRGKAEIYDRDSLAAIAFNAQSAGIGELLLNCVDNDGSKQGLDLSAIMCFDKNSTLPIILSSGAGKPEHFLIAFDAGADAVAAGTFFSKLDQNPLQLRSRLLNKGVHLRK
jgi:cyclase